ncbi:hypothetical protein AMK27_38810 [Streptomyces sp. CB02009]|uniref:hypothetical protein n=1 Tax=Streptomyces sp. CB02009 TaxID=1703938 RepID=UPI00093C13AF|nr:hypothetical protein [Streptomyces sp. CB02009]OKJ48095.1 hypothetical protein AMK27_38810 [Streptomyces sp. CB02009]
MPLSPTHSAASTTQNAAASAWPATAEAADAELAHLAELLAEAGVTAVPGAGVLAAPGLAAGPGDTAGIRVRTTANPPHALYLIAAGRLTPHTTAGSAFAHLRPLLEAAARPCDGCGAEAGEPCNPHCLPDPTTD